jgi:hypothetical protein
MNYIKSSPSSAFFRHAARGTLDIETFLPEQNVESDCMAVLDGDLSLRRMGVVISNSLLPVDKVDDELFILSSL